MANYIDKSALVAEIERLENKLYYEPENFKDVGAKMALDSLKSALDTLEVKELLKEPVSEDVEEAMKRAAEETRLVKAKNGQPFFSEVDFNLGFSNGAQWQKQQLPKWKKKPTGGCWSGEIAVHPIARLFRYEHYVINADKLFELLSKEK